MPFRSVRSPKPQAIVGERGVDGSQDLLGHLSFFAQAAKSKDADAVGVVSDAGETYKFRVRRERIFVDRQSRQTRPLANAQHRFRLKRRSGVIGRWCTRVNRRQQPSLRRPQTHRVRGSGIVWAPLSRTHVRSEVLLLHGDIVRHQVGTKFGGAAEFWPLPLV